jgi:putative PIN family toxin of toxin-antitoxin system
VKVILDTNVFISGVFFTGPPHKILKAWRDEKIKPVLSIEIFEEYHRVGQILKKQFPGADLEPILNLIVHSVELQQIPNLPEQVCEDPDDDKFIACALTTGTKTIITGDKKLLSVSGYSGIEMISPRLFVNKYL